MAVRSYQPLGAHPQELGLKTARYKTVCKRPAGPNEPNPKRMKHDPEPAMPEDARGDDAGACASVDEPWVETQMDPGDDDPPDDPSDDDDEQNSESSREEEAQPQPMSVMKRPARNPPKPTPKEPDTPTELIAPPPESLMEELLRNYSST